MFRVGITSFAFFPLSTANPTQSAKIIDGVAKQVAELKKGGKLPPGLAEQYDIQLETLRSDTLPDLEIVAIPGHMSFAGKHSSSLFCSLRLTFHISPTRKRQEICHDVVHASTPFLSRTYRTRHCSLSSLLPCLIATFQHATSKDHVSQPEIDPNYLSWDIGERFI